MFQSILQRLTIVHESDDQLVLREQPIMDWGIAAALVLTGLIMLIAAFWITGILAFAFAAFFFLQANTRTITFNTNPNIMCIRYQSLLNQNQICEVSLHSISRAYLHRGEDDGVQVVLTMTDGEEMGLSSYIKDKVTWQEDVVLAINGLLHNAHKDDPNRDLMV